MRTKETAKPTIKDVAQRAGVSPTTVSYVINNTRFVNPDTAARVRAAITELDYHPDFIARSLRARRTLTVGMVVSDITNPFYADVVRGAEDVFSHNDYSLILCNTDESPENELCNLQMLCSKKVDGLLIVASGENADFLYETNRTGLPVVLVDRRLPGNRLDTVIVDDEQGAYHAVHHLLEHGHRRIGMITPRPGLSTSIDRIHGYTRALHDFDLTPDLIHMVDGNSTIEGGAAAAHHLLDLQPAPTAIFASNNLMAIGLYLAVKQRSLNCPKDVAIAGFDDMAWFSVFNPGMTTVYQPSYELGKRAAELLCQRICGERTNGPSLIELPSRLVIRESCGCGMNQANLFNSLIASKVTHE
jgi:LacI family transcriptional regulator